MSAPIDCVINKTDGACEHGRLRGNEPEKFGNSPIHMVVGAEFLSMYAHIYSGDFSTWN